MVKKKIFQLCVELTNGELSSKALKKLTKSNLSRLMIQPFAKVYDIDTDEILDELDDFRNLNEFFIRKLHPNARPIDKKEDSFVSPTDGVISEVGHISENSTFIVKNQVYNVKTLVGDKEFADKYKGGTYIIIYLSPKNYHRIHFPLNSQVKEVYSLGKYSYPVNKLGLELGDNILSYNYRQVYKLSGKINYTLIPVGAQNVNSIIPTYESIYVKKGDELGYFEFGSTVVLLFEKDNILLEENLENKVIKMGEKIATVL
ncbi:phosphatidylserine decarboxylase [Gemella sp. ND 6198]|uniref:phosphatidylserine decarboxylase n=1 Tax=Gemella sp. ND 6198 TaxID=2040624 RepID=UPI000E0A3915|nr:phosphatidylserine decarboxylase [Gemella sp. ND 6198]AXI26082.1 phosphatidylserine decarboxylase [Gemella sp. ND 6198]